MTEETVIGRRPDEAWIWLSRVLMTDDDLPLGRILSRRDAVRLLAVTGAGMVVACRQRDVAPVDSTAAPATPASAGVAPQCVVKPELTVGPYFVDRQLNRSDIRESRDGVPLALSFDVQYIRNGGCAPLVGAMVDIWQCDAAGHYSGVADQMIGFDTTGQTFLRGYQLTDEKGAARFTTIYPGWYAGRAVHLHFKIRTHEDAATRDDASVAYEFTSQLFFDDALTDRVHAQSPYTAKGRREVRNENDGIYRQSGGSLLLDTKPAGDGYAAIFPIALDLSNKEVGARDRDSGPGGRGRRGVPPRP